MSHRQCFLSWVFLVFLVGMVLLTRPAFAVEYQDSGYIDAPAEPLTVEESVICLHNDIHFAVYTLVPLGVAILVFVLGCVWFYCTFIKI